MLYRAKPSGKIAIFYTSLIQGSSFPVDSSSESEDNIGNTDNS
jgi:hypothetical protein